MLQHKLIILYLFVLLNHSGHNYGVAFGNHEEYTTGFDFNDGDMDTRVVGGEPVTPGEIPYQVFIEKIWNSTKIYKCGGSIYNREFILTAAHCLYFMDNGNFSSPRKIWITAGTHDLVSKDPEVRGYQQVTWAKEIFPHENFSYEETKNGRFPIHDIALVRLFKPLVYSDRVQPIQIAPKGFLIKGEGLVTGWGRPDPQGRWTRQMRKASIPLIEWQKCSNKFTNAAALITSKMFCTIPLNRTTNGNTRNINNKTPCNGDSGGPIVCKEGGNGLKTLCGISSFGAKNCAGESVYTRISSYHKWIKDIAGNQDS